MDSLKLHLGCGGKILDGYDNIDIQPCPKSEAVPDFYHDLRESLPYDKESVDEIYVENMITMFSRKEWRTAKKHWVNLLKQGGKLDVIFPDFEQNVKNFLENKDGQKWTYWVQTIYGGQEDPHDFFKSCYSFETLKKDLEEEGMSAFEEKTVNQDTPFRRLVCYKSNLPKILMGVPIHRKKDYSFLRWVEAISKLDYPNIELFVIDNSPDTEYVEYVKAKLPENFKSTVIHIDVDKEDPEERISYARELIRKKVIDEGFDWWFSWETDTIAPPNILKELLSFGDRFKLIHHMSPSRRDPDVDQENQFGLSLVHRDWLEKFGFLLENNEPAGGKVDPLMPTTWHGVDSWFNRRVLRESEGNFIELYGVVKPILHLDE